MDCEREFEHEQAVKRAKAEGKSPEALSELCKAFKMLADPTRMKIVLALMQGEMCVYHLAEVTGGTVSGVSHQLRLLRESKIVKTRRLGKNIEYSLTDEHVLSMVKTALAHLSCKEIVE